MMHSDCTMVCRGRNIRIRSCSDVSMLTWAHLAVQYYVLASAEHARSADFVPGCLRRAGRGRESLKEGEGGRNMIHC